MFILLSLIAGAILLGALGESPVIGALIGLLLGWVYQLSERILQLEQTQIQAKAQPLPHKTTETENARSVAASPATKAHIAVPPPPPRTMAEPAAAMAQEPVAKQTPEHAPYQPQGNVLDKGMAAAWNWLVGGNPFVRAGIVLLFFGVVFLLRYSLEHNLVPVELRLAGAAGGALALLAYGWKLRKRAGSYGLILQAGGVGLLYLTVFGAFSLYHLLPPMLAFGLLVVIAAAAAALAVVQNSLPLAAFATTGGFLAPLLVSSGSNNYIGLFSFYVILNAGIVGIAWFKSWRLLNLLGFVFTFVIASLWGWDSYRPKNFGTTEPFLIVFFLFYVAIAVLFASRTPVSFKDKVDSTLVFGTPIIGFGMQVALVKQFEYGIAISAIVLGAFYLLASWGIWKRFGKPQQLLAETFLALGVIFTTLAIPFAVDEVATSAAWAIEGVGILWVSIRQQQWLRGVFAILLQYAALTALLWEMARHSLPVGDFAFFNGQFLTIALITTAMLVSSRLLSAEFAGKRRTEQAAALALLFTGLTFLSLMFEQQIDRFDLGAHFTALHLGYAVLASSLLLLMGRLSEWSLLKFVLLLPLLLMGLALLSVIGQEHSLLDANGWWLWPLAFASLYAVLYQYQQREWFAGWLEFAQVALVWLLTVLLGHETHHWMQTFFPPANAWYVASLPLAAIAVLWLLMRGKLWPVHDHATVLLQYVGVPLAGMLGLWWLASLSVSGDSSPLAWLPVLNPLDLVTGLLGITWLTLNGAVAKHGTVQKTTLALAFLWLNVTLLRAQHHWGGLPWEFPDLVAEPGTQTLLAILWTLSGMGLAWRGNRISSRKLWTAGAMLLGVVVLKLFVVDFASSGTLARVVSFISVGVLLLFIGYLAPLPPAEKMDEVA